MKIKHPVRGLIPFEMFSYQEDLVKSYGENRFNIILKARQLGISEITASYAAWLILFHRDKNVLVMATKVDTAKNIISKVKTAIQYIPKWLMLGEMTTDNKLSVELTNGSVMKAIATSHDAGRSEALSLLIVDEAAHIKGFDELWTGLLPTVQAGGRIIMMSTPNGVGNVFHHVYSQAEAEQNEFHPTKLMWWEHPEHIEGLTEDTDVPGGMTSRWFIDESSRLSMSRREIAQELACDFLASGDTVIDSITLERIDREVFDPIFIENWDRNLHIWQRQEFNKRYMISADVARGDGKDFSAFHVWDLDLMTQAAEYMAKVPPDEYARTLCRVGRDYNNALLVIENNSVGLACLEHVKIEGYPAVYYTSRKEHIMGEIVDTQYGPQSSDTVPGFTTSPKTRPLIITKLEECIRNCQVTIRSKRAAAQLRTFVWVNGRPEAMRKYNDDLVMSAAIGAWIRETFLGVAMVSMDLQRKMIEGIGTHRVLNTQIDGACKDPRLAPARMMTPFSKMQNPYALSMPDGTFGVLNFAAAFTKKFLPPTPPEGKPSLTSTENFNSPDLAGGKAEKSDTTAAFQSIVPLELS